MTDRIALSLGLVIASAVALDLYAGFGASVFLARRFLDLVDWAAFWR